MWFWLYTECFLSGQQVTETLPTVKKASHVESEKHDDKNAKEKEEIPMDRSYDIDLKNKL